MLLIQCSAGIPSTDNVDALLGIPLMDSCTGWWEYLPLTHLGFDSNGNTGFLTSLFLHLVAVLKTDRTYPVIVNIGLPLV